MSDVFLSSLLQWEMLGLFGSSFLASTLLPGGSEALVMLMQQQGYQEGAIWVSATLGNTLGSMLTFVMGWVAVTLTHKESRHQALVQKIGYPVLLLAWLPIVGDLFCLAAGWLKFRWWIALIFILVGKGLRYLMVMGAAQWLI